MAQLRQKKRIRVVGVYTLPYAEALFAVEVIIQAPPHHIDFSLFHLYEPPAWDSNYHVGVAHFYLSEDGERLIGSYLNYEATHGGDFWSWSRERQLQFLRRTTRALMLTHDFPFDYATPFGIVKMPNPSAIPERLLRLIWVEEGMPGQSNDQVQESF